METKIYQSIDNPELGFTIQEQDQYIMINNVFSKSGLLEYTLWIDNYEGGDAYMTDWDQIDDVYDSFGSAMAYIVENYGKVKLVH